MSKLADNARATLPYPTADPLDRLRHVVAAYADTDANRIAVQATANVYPERDTIDGHSTGLTYGDLRVLLERLGG